ncbi:MAG: hypothetical protein M0027_02665 [Candidatus Dormibacteraeota bacterium]|jgi:hypothetical protein|nr:hypothetical protein [Candidatus Dormibacteraeota bacterium]
MNAFYSVLLLELGVTLLALLAAGAYWRWRHLAWPSSPASHEPRPIIPARIFLRCLLGSLWVLDGLLQAQPSMPAGFPGGILAPVAVGQPVWLQALLHWEIRLWQVHPVHLAAATVLIQVGIGLAILTGGDTRIGRVGLWSSVVWGVLVWILGEAAGGLLGPGASLLSGSPGSVLAYVAAAALLLAPVELWQSGKARRIIEVGVGTTFLIGALLQTLPSEGFWTPAGLRTLFAPMAAVPQPAFLSGPITALARLVATDPLLWNSVFIFAMLGIGVGLCLIGGSRGLTIVALVWTAFAWWFGQDFGMFGTGVATDPNLAPLMAVLLLTAQLSSDGLWRALGRIHPRQHPVLLRRLALAGLAAILIGVLGGLPYASQGAFAATPVAQQSATQN